MPATDRGSKFFTLLNRPGDRDGLVLMRTSTPLHDCRGESDGSDNGPLALAIHPSPCRDAPTMGGLTAGHIVFGADLETLFALDADTGAELWRIETGGEILAAPATYELAGRQYAAVASGRSILTFALLASVVQSGSASAVH